MAKYAKNTSVPVERSRSEVEKLLTKYGADQFSSGWTTNRAVIMFRMKERYIRIEMPLPALEKASNNWQKQKGHYYSIDDVAKETRRRWRAMVLYIKGKLESVESEIVSFEEAFLAHVVLPNKQTVGQHLTPQIEAAYGSGSMPKQLSGW